MLVAVGTLVLTVLLYILIPKGFFPLQDTGFIQAITTAGPTVSFDEMARRQQALAAEDPAGPGCGQPVLLHRRGRHQHHAQQRPLPDQSEGQERPRRRHHDHGPAGRSDAHAVPGITFYLQPVQDLTIDSVVSRAQYQFVLQAATTAALNEFVPKLLAQLQKAPALRNVSTDYLDKGLSAYPDGGPRHRGAFRHHRRDHRQCAL